MIKNIIINFDFLTWVLIPAWFSEYDRYNLNWLCIRIKLFKKYEDE